MKTIFSEITKVILLLFSAGLGLLAGVIMVTPVIVWMNYQAQDGPIFPAPLVALAVVAPVSFILFIFQCLVLAYEWIAKRCPGNSLLGIGLVCGLVASLIPYLLAIAPYQSTPNFKGLLAYSGLGIILGLIVFGCHWLANLVNVINSRNKIIQTSKR